MITSYMIFVNQKYYAWVLIYLTKKINFVIGQTERLFDYQSKFQSKFQSNFQSKFQSKF